MKNRGDWITVYEGALRSGFKDPEAPPSNLIEFSSWVQSMLEKVPVDKRDSAEIDFSTEWDGSSIEVAVGYWDEGGSDVATHDAEER